MEDVKNFAILLSFLKVIFALKTSPTLIEPYTRKDPPTTTTTCRGASHPHSTQKQDLL